MSEAVLYIVATPIGNLDDMVPRALKILQSVDVIAAEDTRHSSRLMQHFSITTPMIACHDHNEEYVAEKLIEKLRQGEQIALISDAGTPLISDPGYRVVTQVRDAGFKVVPVPGACAMVAALCASGLPSDRFIFEGFLPAKESGRRQRLQRVVDETATLIYYESPHRIVASLSSIAEVFGGDREVVLARELTKTFETIKALPVAEMVAWVESDRNQQKGEIVLLVRGAPKREQGEALDAETLRVLKILAAEVGDKQGAVLAAKVTGEKKNKLYKWLIANQ
ncbi:Ribosomal RNA small subunit methyltransferase I [Sinobacterium norvegicum]|uniref:Ribosomal RNA small subunit methyltransferase I n=1 Tax=Sinobacterium norvegicum TaxID=1641715 RepID=A0ABN8EL71_9GAMM|nr:16S rRNA (cytidine(1402)-2'-O)-methyltransferase [Sinobacterium norvegicum]CAH0993155.1 Ribosomal RNA small subunit methyltransferase I [Sinobacterium norvegicum]